MPTYVYKFIDTGETLEVQQAFTDDALTEAVHPSTGETKPVKKVFLPVGVTFKGGGFYKTDSRNGAKAGSSNGSSDSGTSGEGGSGSAESAGAATTGSGSGDTGSTGSASNGSASAPGAKTPGTTTPAQPAPSKKTSEAGAGTPA